MPRSAVSYPAVKRAVPPRRFVADALLERAAATVARERASTPGAARRDRPIDRGGERPGASGLDDLGPPTFRDPAADHARASVRARLFEAPTEAMRIGRFELLQPVGVGGMGVVFAARDVELDRDVAIKLLHSQKAEPAGRLLREAKAMARLAHPNVVTVYEAGTAAGQVYLAMEFVRGLDLKRWLQQGRRSWREVVELLVQAAHGLAAAHEAGLVHRDFKPANVLITEGGQAKVADFGLARAAATTTTSVELISGVSPLETFTRTGAIVGTPAYLPPEILDGKVHDERGDQFSFCVTAYEAIYGHRPFTGTSLLHMAERMKTGRFSRVSERTGPRALRRILMRGLAVEPSERHASMTELARALESTLHRRRRWLLGLGTTVAVAAAAAAIAWPGAPSLCTGAEDAWAQTWSPQQRAAVVEAMTATAHPGATDASRRVLEQLDAYGAHWTAAHREACTATHVRAEQSVEVLDRQMACLDARRNHAHALVERLRVADRDSVGRATVAAEQLPRIDSCLEGTAGASPLPEDPQVRAKVQQLRTELSDAQVRGQLGRSETAAPQLVELQREIDALGHRPLMVDVRRVRAASSPPTPQIRDLLYEALHLAEASDYTEGQREVWTELAASLSYLGDYEASERAAAHAQAFIERTGNDPVARALLMEAQAFSRLEQSRFDDAVALAEDAVHTLERHDREHPRVGNLYGSLGTIYTLVERHDEAKRAYERAWEHVRRHYGERHESVALAMMNLGRVEKRRGRTEASNAWYRRAIALYETLGEGDSTGATTALDDLGHSYGDQQRYTSARSRGRIK